MKKNNVEDVKELVMPNLEAVKKAIEVCIDYEKASGILLVTKKGRIEFSKIYKREESRNRVRQLVEESVRDEVHRQLSPIEQKLNAILEIQTGKKIKEIEKDTVPFYPIKEIDTVLRKHEK